MGILDWMMRRALSVGIIYPVSRRMGERCPVWRCQYPSTVTQKRRSDWASAWVSGEPSVTVWAKRGNDGES